MVYLRYYCKYQRNVGTEYLVGLLVPTLEVRLALAAPTNLPLPLAGDGRCAHREAVAVGLPKKGPR